MLRATLFLGRCLRIRPHAVLAGGKAPTEPGTRSVLGVSGLSLPSLSLSSVTLQWGSASLTLMSLSSSTTHTCTTQTPPKFMHLVPRSPGGGTWPGSVVPRPAWWENPADASPLAPTALALRTELGPSGPSPEVGIARCSQWGGGLFRGGWGRAYGTCLKSGHQAPGSRGGLAPGARQG